MKCAIVVTIDGKPHSLLFGRLKKKEAARLAKRFNRTNRSSEFRACVVPRI
jgi:hypothetical protein